jgi:hypothetical protein
MFLAGSTFFLPCLVIFCSFNLFFIRFGAISDGSDDFQLVQLVFFTDSVVLRLVSWCFQLVLVFQPI